MSETGSRKNKRKPSFLTTALSDIQSKPEAGAGEGGDSQPARRARSQPGFEVATGQETRIDKSAQSMAVMEEQIKDLSARADSVLKVMPVTKIQVRLKLEEIDPELVDVSPENERAQDLLNKAAVADIYASFQQQGQQVPGTVRPKEGGRYELIEGSRRLWCARDLKRKYLAFVGDIPDSDVRVLSRTENEHKSISVYEKAVSFQKDISDGLYKTWEQLSAAEGISKGMASNYKALVVLDPVVVRAFANVNDITAKFAVATRQALSKGGKSAKAVLDVANQIAAQNQQALSAGDDPLPAEEVAKLLRTAGKEKAVEARRGAPEVFKGAVAGSELKKSVTNKGAVKIEIKGLSEDAVERILEACKKELI